MSDSELQPAIIIPDAQPKVHGDNMSEQDIQLRGGEILSGYESHFELMLGTLLSGCTNDALEGRASTNRMQDFVDYWDKRNPCPEWQDTPETRQLIQKAKRHLFTRFSPDDSDEKRDNRIAFEQIARMIGATAVHVDSEDKIVQKLIRIKGLGSVLRIASESAAQEMAQRLGPKAGESVVYTREVGFVLDHNKLHMMQALVKDTEVLELIQTQGFSDIGSYAKAVADGKVHDTNLALSPSDDVLMQELVRNSSRRKRKTAYMRILATLDTENQRVSSHNQISDYLRHPGTFWKEYYPNAIALADKADPLPEQAGNKPIQEKRIVNEPTTPRLTPQVKLSLLNALIPVYYPHVFKKESEIPDATMLVTARTDFIRFSAKSNQAGEGGTVPEHEIQAIQALRIAVRHNLHGISLGELQQSDKLKIHADQIRDAIQLMEEGKIFVQIGEIKLDIGQNQPEHWKIGHKYKEDVAHSVTAILQTLSTLDRGLEDPIPLCLCARILLDDDPIRAIRRTLRTTAGGMAGSKRVIEQLRGGSTPPSPASVFQENMLRLFSILEQNVSVSLAHYQWNLSVEDGADGVGTIPLELASTPPVTDIFTYPPRKIHASIHALTSKLVKTWIDQQGADQSAPLGARLRKGASLGYADIDSREVDQTPPNSDN